jgi:hypothetical protein
LHVVDFYQPDACRAGLSGDDRRVRTRRQRGNDRRLTHCAQCNVEGLQLRGLAWVILPVVIETDALTLAID